MLRSATLLLIALPPLFVQCTRGPAVVEIRGSMRTAAGLPLTGVAVTALYNTDSGVARKTLDTTDFAGRFVLSVPAARFVHFTAKFGHIDLTDRDLVTPPSGALELAGFEQQHTYYILAADSASPFGHAFNVLGDRGLLDSPLLLVNPDSIDYRANAAHALDRILTAWRGAREPMIRQALAATLLVAGPRFLGAGDAAVMLRELDVTSHVYDVVPFTVVLQRARSRALFPTVAASALRYDATFRAGLRAAVDSVLADSRASPPVRAAALVRRIHALREDGDTAASRMLLVKTKREFPALLAGLDVPKPVERAGPLAAPRALPAFSAATLSGDRRVSLDRGVLRAEFTLIDFWATWCAACIEELPVITSEYTSRSRPAFDVISVTFDDNMSEVRAFRRRNHAMPWRHWRLPLAFDDPAARALGILSIPHPILVDSAWRVVAEGAAVRGANLRATLDTLLQGNAPPSNKPANSRQ